MSSVDVDSVSTTVTSISNSAERAEQLLDSFDGEGLNATIGDAKAAAEAPAEEVEEAGPESIDDAQAAAQEEGKN